MTNLQAYKILKQKLDNWQKLGLLEHFDLVLNKLPEVCYLAKYRPNELYKENGR